MTKSKFIGDQKREQIRAFCERATDTGGILLVSGSRGLGKTRLVDEALNDRSINNMPKFFNQLFGNVSNSQRVSVTREPNRVKRHIIKIDVDPYFPYPHTDAETTPNETAPNENTLSIALIRNIVFGLTSVIDCHYSQCKHGKTMREKLGFRDYWFSKNALHWRAKQWQSWTVLLIFSLILLIVFITTVPDFFPESGADFLLVIIISALVSCISWLFLRFRDWRCLKKMSEKLYALVHAENVKKTTDKDQQSQQNNVWLSVLLILIFVFLCIGASESFAGLFESLQDYLTTVSDTLKVLLGGSLAAALVWTSSQRSQQHSEFGDNNPVWMITLLKRYLNLCHRCGIEPVLVFDELDKLEDMEDWWNRRLQETNHTADNPGQAIQQNKRPPKLDEFLLTLARLKASLGAEFLWVLIGGPNVYSRLRQDRHNRSDGALGLLATTIQQEVLVEPISFNDTQRLFEATYAESVSEENIKTLWLRSYANLSTIIRNHEKKCYSYHETTAILADKLSELWRPEIQLEYLDFTQDKIWLDKIHEDWVQSWIHTGMLVFANDLLKKPIRYRVMRNQIYEHWPNTLEAASDIEINPAILILQSEDARSLMALGKQLLFSYLTSEGHLNNPQDDESKTEYVKFTH